MNTKPHIVKRFFAGFIDYSLVYTFFIAYVIAFGEPNNEGEYSVSGLHALVPMIFWGIITVGLETMLGGTLGNSIVGLKAIPKSGTNRNLTFAESLKRHLLDPIDMFFFGLIAIVVIKNTDKHQRLGDIWGNTIVVENKNLPNNND
jgi:uncharacterized RDD family membrane protein YckC